jgi:hypothetical protein
VPPALQEWRRVRGDHLYHDNIRELLQHLGILENPGTSDKDETLQVCRELWRDEMRPRLEVLVEGTWKVLSPRSLLPQVQAEETKIADWEAGAFALRIFDGKSLSDLFEAVEKATRKMDGAIGKIPLPVTSDAVLATREAVRELEAALKALPNSPIIP